MEARAATLAYRHIQTATREDSALVLFSHSQPDARSHRWRIPFRWGQPVQPCRRQGCHDRRQCRECWLQRTDQAAAAALLQTEWTNNPVWGETSGPSKDCSYSDAESQGGSTKSRITVTPVFVCSSAS